MIRAIALLLIMSSTCFAQIKVDIVKAPVVSGLKNPRLVSGLIVIGEGSKPTVGEAAFVRLTTEYPTQCIVVEAQRDAFDFIELSKTGDYEWMLQGSGAFLVTVDAMPPGEARFRQRYKVELGGSVIPDPPKPDPDPPTPSPIQNIFNVGKVSFESRPVDQATAVYLAKSYKLHAGKLYGSPTLADIQTILLAIDKDFNAKQCPTQEICSQWATWKSKVQAAMVAEQKKRGTFNRNEWFECLMEIAYSLEATK